MCDELLEKHDGVLYNWRSGNPFYPLVLPKGVVMMRKGLADRFVVITTRGGGVPRAPAATWKCPSRPDSTSSGRHESTR
jgi:hypothetical protein